MSILHVFFRGLCDASVRQFCAALILQRLGAAVMLARRLAREQWCYVLAAS